MQAMQPTIEASIPFEEATMADSPGNSGVDLDGLSGQGFFRFALLFDGGKVERQRGPVKSGQAAGKVPVVFYRAEGLQLDKAAIAVIIIAAMLHFENLIVTSFF